MLVKYDKDFFIYKGKKFQNWKRLNDSGYLLLDTLKDILKDKENASEFYENCQEIVVTSQDRTKLNKNHNSGKAIDFCLYPLGMNLWLYLKLLEYKTTVYISSINRHLHFDSRDEGRAGVEIEKPGQEYPDIGEVEFSMIKISEMYELFKLPNLKAKIIFDFSNPFTTGKKIIQRGSSIEKDIWNNTFPDDDSISWWWIVAGVGVAYIMYNELDKSENKKYA